MPQALDALWEPIELGSLTLRNRVMAGPATLLYADDNVLSERHIAFYRERAAGGAGVIVSEEHAAHPTRARGVPACVHGVGAAGGRAVHAARGGGARARRPTAHPALRAGAGGLVDAQPRRLGTCVGAVGDRRPRRGAQRRHGAGRHREHGGRLRDVGVQRRRGGARWRRAARRARLADRAVPQPDVQPAHRRLRRLDGGPLPARAGDRPGRARPPAGPRARAAALRRRVRRRRRDHPGGDRPPGRDPGRERPVRLPQPLHRKSVLAPPDHPADRHPGRRARRARAPRAGDRAGADRHRAPRPHPPPRDRRAAAGGGRRRHRRDDPGPPRRAGDRAADAATARRTR